MGTIVGHFGVAGEVKVDALDSDAFAPGRAVVIESEGVEHAASVLAARPHQRRLLVRFSGVDDANDARALRGGRVLADRTSLEPSPPGEFRVADLVGFEVHDARLGALGLVIAVRHYPASDMLVVGESERLIPMLHAYGFSIDPARRVIEVSLPQGFEEL